MQRLHTYRNLLPFPFAASFGAIVTIFVRWVIDATGNWSFKVKPHQTRDLENASGAASGRSRDLGDGENVGPAGSPLSRLMKNAADWLIGQPDEPHHEFVLKKLGHLRSNYQLRPDLDLRRALKSALLIARLGWKQCMLASKTKKRSTLRSSCTGLATDLRFI